VRFANQSSKVLVRSTSATRGERTSTERPQGRKLLEVKSTDFDGLDLTLDGDSFAGTGKSLDRAAE
jgi:hypothetical protein